MSENEEIIREFLIESYEGLDQVDRHLVALEQDPTDRETLDGIFRTVHTIKGTSGCLGFSKLMAITHCGENLLSRLRRGELEPTPEITSGLLAMVDAVRRMLGQIEASHTEGDTDHSALLDTLTRLQGSSDSAERSAESEAQGEPAPPCPAAAASDSPCATRSELPEGSPGGTPGLQPVPGRLGGVLVQWGWIRPEDLAQALELQAGGDQRRIGELLVELGVVSPSELTEALRILAKTPGLRVAESTIRVDVALIDELIRLVEELALELYPLSEATPGSGLRAPSKDGPPLHGARHPEPGAALQRLDIITAELQEKLMKSRMQPIANVWSRFPRVVRDLAVTCGKEVQIETEGAEIELDRTIIEAIKDPLTHLVRNAVDHGIETPEIRAARGKPAEGRLLLRACHEGGQVIIELTDDGGGIDAQAIQRKALNEGLITPDQASRMSDREMIGLIFRPGFSTASRVTHVSGRGVGMDVVQTNIQKIGGTIDCTSVVGQGTTIKIRIPMTLAIMPALIVKSRGLRYALPQVRVLELVRVEADQVRGATYRLRGKRLPLVYLDHVLEGGEEDSPTCAQAPHPSHLVVLEAEANGRHAGSLPVDFSSFGLVVDAIEDIQEIVVKPKVKLLDRIPTFAGATILRDGAVALILDVQDLAQRAGVSPKDRELALVGDGGDLKPAATAGAR